MWYGVRTMAEMGTYGRGGAYDRVWRHVAGCGGMWKRWWQGVGPCHRGRGKWYRVRPVA